MSTEAPKRSSITTLYALEALLYFFDRVSYFRPHIVDAVVREHHLGLGKES
jgi:hypothetical protein